MWFPLVNGGFDLRCTGSKQGYQSISAPKKTTELRFSPPAKRLQLPCFHKPIFAKGD
jgi:hypothetical protein